MDSKFFYSDGFSSHNLFALTPHFRVVETYSVQEFELNHLLGEVSLSRGKGTTMEAVALRGMTHTGLLGVEDLLTRVTSVINVANPAIMPTIAESPNAVEGPGEHTSH
mgnify:CR=1 FL=1